MAKRKKLWLWIGGILGLALVAMLVIASNMAHRLDPYIRQQVLLYLRERFDSDVEIQALRIHMPNTSSLRMFLTHRRGALANVEGEGVRMRYRNRGDAPPMFVMKSFSFDFDLADLFDKVRKIQNVTIDGMEINIPPRHAESVKSATHEEDRWENSIVFENVTITNSRLTVLPKDPRKVPLKFDLHDIHLESIARQSEMHYTGALTNPRPPGEIISSGSFGPWVAEDPGNTPLRGDYTFDDADLGVFAGIAGTLHSKGAFIGTLSDIDVSGEATVPNFSLKQAGNQLPLKTQFQVHVDGTNGDTILKPVVGTLGSTTFTTSGTVIKNEPGAAHRSIQLDVIMPHGNLRNVLSLAMKGPPFMEGRIALKTRIDIPPLSGKVREKLLLDGTFEITDGKFLRSTIQDQIDSLSRRSQGQPGNEDIDEVVSQMGGRFTLEDEVIRFFPVSFSVPGSGIDLTGSYDLDQDVLDFQGTLKMQAKVSQTMTGWKHWVLKPFDSFFSKQGAGTLLKIKVEGTAEKPSFGLNHGRKPDNKTN